MPLDAALPPARLRLRSTADEIARHFPNTFGVRVDLNDLPAEERLRLAGARLPEPPEARLLDRVLQIVPPPMLAVVQRILIVDSGAIGPFGSYRDGIARVFTPVLRLALRDPLYGDYSCFTTTVLHEVAHAAHDGLLTTEQRAAVVDLYLTHLIESPRMEEVEPTSREAEHFFVGLVVAGLLGVGYGGWGVARVQESVQTLGLPVR